MHDFMKGRRIFLTLLFLACLGVVATADICEAKNIKCVVQGSNAGGVGEGTQLIKFKALFRNTSKVVYISRVNWVEVEVHGYFRGREEKYKRKVDVNWYFDPILEPGQQKSLKIKFRRKVQPQRGMFPYDDVEIRVLNINYSRAS